LTLIGPERMDVPAALAAVDALLVDDPQDANALLLRASLLIAEDRLDDATADLDALDALVRPTGAFLIGTPESLRASIAQARGAAAASTSTTTVPASGASGGGSGSSDGGTDCAPGADGTPNASVSTVPGAPTIPNACGR